MASGANVTPSDNTFVLAPQEFPRENRAPLGQLQNFKSLGDYLAQDLPEYKLLQDFHLLLYLATDPMCSELQVEITIFRQLLF